MHTLLIESTLTVCIIKYILLHIRAGVGNDRLEPTDMLDTWLTNY